MTQCIVLTVQCSYLRRNKGPSVLFSTRYKRVVVTFPDNQRLNIGSEYHKNATQVALGIIEKFEEPHNIIPHQIDETLKERQIKYSKIGEALDIVFYLTGKQGISCRGTQETQTQRHKKKESFQRISFLCSIYMYVNYPPPTQRIFCKIFQNFCKS